MRMRRRWCDAREKEVGVTTAMHLIVHESRSGVTTAMHREAPPVCMSVCLPVCMPVCLLVCLPVCMLVCLPVLHAMSGFFTFPRAHLLWLEKNVRNAVIVSSWMCAAHV